MASSSSALLSSLLVLFSILLFGFTEARDILVGGNANAWKIPSNESASLSLWAAATRFRIGDSLVWKYDPKKDLVLQVTKEAYTACNTSNPIAAYKDGNTKVELDRSGPFYFISGTEDNCQKGEKMTVVVLSPRHHGSGSSAPAPAPAVAQEGPALSPTSGVHGLRSGFSLVLLGSLVGMMLL